jgi:hypothetical protein
MVQVGTPEDWVVVGNGGSLITTALAASLIRLNNASRG